MTDHKIQSNDNRALSFSDYGRPSDMAVLHCHGAPGSRLFSKRLIEEATRAGFRFIGIDRPGYGGSTALPGRSICDWANDAFAIADHLDIDKFLIQGTSTGGSYSLATASLAPDRVLGVLVSCGMTDMTWADCVKEAVMETCELMTTNRSIWNAPDRETAIALTIEIFGEKGQKMLNPDPNAPPRFSPPDIASLSDPEYKPYDPNNEPFAQGVIGYADDRIADGPANGWSSFDLSRVTCPVLIIHGEQDWIVPVAHAHHTTSLLKDAELRTFANHGHLSIKEESVRALVDLWNKLAS